MRTLRVCALYPDLMNIYADRGNLPFLQRRCAWRGLGFALAGAGIGDPVDPDAHDLFYLGGGQDRDQALCARDLAQDKRGALHAAAARGAVVFAVCGGYQLLGSRLRARRRASSRASGSWTSTPSARTARGCSATSRSRSTAAGRARAVLAGFENHGGRTHLGAGEPPLGEVLKGNGNNGRDGHEGVLGGRTAPSWGRTCTGRCCRRTPSSPTG